MDKTHRDKTCHVDCFCKSLDHVMRVWHYRLKDSDNKFDNDYYIEYHLTRFPQTHPSEMYTFKPRTSFINRWENFKEHIEMKKNIISGYFRTIWWAIRGRPYYFNAETVLSMEDAERLGKFLLKEVENDKEIILSQ